MVNNDLTMSFQHNAGGLSRQCCPGGEGGAFPEERVGLRDHPDFEQT
jgi:hypothetical protein